MVTWKGVAGHRIARDDACHGVGQGWNIVPSKTDREPKHGLFKRKLSLLSFSFPGPTSRFLFLMPTQLLLISISTMKSSTPWSVTKSPFLALDPATACSFHSEILHTLSGGNHQVSWSPDRDEMGWSSTAHLINPAGSRKMKVLSFPLSRCQNIWKCWPRKVVKVGNLKSVWIWDLRCRVKLSTGPSYSGSSSFSSATHGWGGQSQMGWQELNRQRSCQSWRWKYQQEYWILTMMVLWIFRQCWILMSHIKMVFLLIRFDFEPKFVYEDALKKIFTANPLNLTLRNPTPRTESRKKSSLFWKNDGNFWQQFCFPTWILFAKATY